MRMHGYGGRAVAVSAGFRSAIFATTASAALLSSPVTAAVAPDVPPETLTAFDLVMLVMLIGTVSFAVISAIALMRARNRAEIENADLRLQVADFKATADRAEILIDAKDERLVAWATDDEAPLVAGTLPANVGAPTDRARFLAFGTWLKPESAARIDQAVSQLRARGEPFDLTIATVAGRLIEVRGHTIGSAAVARFRDLDGDRLARADLEARYDLLEAEVEAMRAMFSVAPMPIWLRDETGRLVWVNAAYAAAVEAADETDAAERGLELLDSSGRQMIREGHKTEPVFLKRLPAIVAGSRRIFDVTDVDTPNGSGGIAIDVSGAEAAQAALRREIDFNARTLDQLATAVAIYGPDRRLKSYNAAYRSLFDLDTAFLESRPDDNAVLDHLRAARKLPEQSDFKSWRTDLFAAYQSVETREHIWHLPDGQTLRVIANPNPQGGMTWVYENVTERLDLESRYNALIHVQGETLDHLAEGVAVFGSDGRLRLHNPSFAAILELDPAVLEGRPHVADIVRACRQPDDDDGDWNRFTACVAGLDESRSSFAGRMERAGNRVIDYASVPLPDGQTMVTFVDVSDTVQVERALVERNEALETADAIKNAFIHHVSYELRSPLTNIIGFTQLLADPRVGPLTERQSEYVGYVMSSSGALLAIVNDILDLATVDAGIMELDLGEVDVGEAVAATIEGVKDRISDSNLHVETDVPKDIGTFVADGTRVRQILFNLLANAIAFSPEGGHVAIEARRDGDTIAFSVSDQGPGIPADFLDTAFDRFASKPQGAARGGAGLGLAIVKSFAELHGGTVQIQSEEGKGSRVTCRLPIRPGIAAAAE